MNPVSGVSSNPLVCMRPSEMRRVAVGVPIASLAPAARGPLLCRVNGEWMLRESWPSLTREGDVIEWHEVPQDRDLFKGVLSLVAAYFTAGLSAAYQIAAQVAVNLAVNALLPPVGNQIQARPQQTGDAFSTSLQGNEARLDQPIWKVCGRREISPPFACQPYFEFLPRVGESDEELDNEQYYYALFAVGIGDHDVAAKIGNTPIGRFADVIRADYLPPGVQPTDVLANVTTAQEVSSQVLETGKYVGGFAACAPRRTVTSIGIDVAATRGLGKSGALTVEWQVEYRIITDFGQILSSWIVLANESRTAFTATPQRWSNKYLLDSDGIGRVEVRLVRTDVQDTSPSALHEIAWIGLRAYLFEPAPLNANAAHFEVVMRASSQLSNAASRDVRLLVTGHVRTYELESSDTWQPAAPSRNGAWWALDLVTSTTWGMAKPEDRVDIASFVECAQIAELRQDRFDYCFDSTRDGWDALQLICRSFRARAFRRNGVISVARDELADVPVTAFTHRNCLPGMSISETLPTRQTPDGVIIDYQDNRAWEWTSIECPCPGYSDMLNPVIIRLEGVTGATHAEREGRYEAASLLYRRRTAAWTTEMQGVLPAYLSPVHVLPDIVGYGQSGDVVGWNEGTLVMTLSEPLDSVSEPLFLTLVRDDGTLTDPVEIEEGDEPNEVVLPDAPDFEIVLDDGTRERPKYLIGPLLGAVEMVKVKSIEDGGVEDGAQLYAMTGIVDDERVHLADVALLPQSDEIQDPVFDPDDVDESGELIVNLSDHTIRAEYLSGVGTNALIARLTLGDDGVLAWFVQNGSGTQSGTFAGEWILSGAIEPSDAGAFEARFTELGGPNADLVATLGSWESLSTDQAVSLEGAGTLDGNVAIIRVEIRDIESMIVQETRTFTLRLDAPEVGGGD